VQARAAAVLDASQRRAQSRAGVPAAHLGRGVGAQIALARRDSPHRGNRHLGLGKALVHEMPHTLAALASGVLSEWRATLLVRETACLDLEDRHRVDELICKDPDSLDGLGDRKLIARIRSITQAIDPASQVRRNAKAVSDRYVSCR
ncbi:HNH endonuclease, partial [Arthrobacter sp. IK3]